MTETPTEVLEPTPIDDAEGDYVDYWGTEDSQNWYFPDKRQFMVVKVMDEGDRSKYERDTSTDLVIEGQTRNTRVKMDMARDRHGLIKSAVVGWNLFRRTHKGPNQGQMEPVAFSDHNLADWLKSANPKLVDELSLFIRKVNPWLFGEMTIEQIDEDIDRLQKVREDLVRKEQGKDDLNSK